MNGNAHRNARGNTRRSTRRNTRRNAGARPAFGPRAPGGDGNAAAIPVRRAPPPL